MEKVTSYIVRMPENKSFGFIKGFGGDEDYFFHRDDYEGNWDSLFTEFNLTKEKVKVKFVVIQTPKGMRATYVELV